MDPNESKLFRLKKVSLRSEASKFLLDFLSWGCVTVCVIGTSPIGTN